MLKNKKIFIVEDNPANRAVMLTILQMHNAQTFFDQWGMTTIKYLKRVMPVDLILMDLMLPRGLTGYDVFDQIQQDPALADIPCAVVSASDPNVEMNRARSMGFRGYICKPLNYQTFAPTLMAIMAGKPVWGEEFTAQHPFIQQLLSQNISRDGG